MRDELNYIYKNRGTWTIVLNTHKTSERYGPFIIPIGNKRLNDYISRYIQFKGLKDGDALFSTANGTIPSTSTFSRYITQAFQMATGIPMNINAIRKVKENYLFHRNPDILNWSRNEQEKYVMDNFMHSLATSELYYKRV